MNTFGGTAPFDTPVNWSSRGYLPHYDAEGKYQMITYRLSDSLPAQVLERVERTLPGSAGSLPAQEALKRRKMIEKYLDAGHGSCILSHPQITQVIVDNWKHFDGRRYDLIAYVVMPNHVHALMTPYEEFELEEVLHSLKSYTSNQINKRLNRSGTVWMEETYDHIVRDAEDLLRIQTYIRANPMKAGLKESDCHVHSAEYELNE